jgi:hypothetical protein
MCSVSEPLLFADNTTIVVSREISCNFLSVLSLVLSYMTKWFAEKKILISRQDKYNEIYNKEFITFYITYWL